MKYKRGQQLTLGTIILIILGIAVLVFLIYGFSVGWGNLWSQITGGGTGRSNINAIITSCKVACATKDVYAFCTEERIVRFGKKVKITLGSKTINTDRTNGTCFEISRDQGKNRYPGVIVESCPDIVCAMLNK